MSVRDYAIIYLRGGKIVSPIAGPGGGNTAPGTMTPTTHALDGPEHTGTTDSTYLDATVLAHGLMPRLSGVASDVWHGDGTWSGGADATEFFEHGAMGATEPFNPDDGLAHTGTIDDDCTATISAPAGDGPLLMEWWITGDGDGHTLTIAATGGTVLGDTPPASVDTETYRLTLDRIPDSVNDWIVNLVGGGSSGDIEFAGHYELLMDGGSPPTPLEDGTGTDWLYVWVP